MLSPENMHDTRNITTQIEHVVFRNIIVHTYIHVIIINEKRGHTFERDQGGVYGRSGWEEG